MTRGFPHFAPAGALKGFWPALFDAPRDVAETFLNRQWAGIDGCPAGWAQVLLDDRRTVLECKLQPSLDEAIVTTDCCPVTLVDIPIGLPSRELPVARRCDLEARRALPGKGSSVFPPPAREALHARDYRKACDVNKSILGKRLSKQAWGIAPKIREADEIFRRRPSLQERVREAHPELCFAHLAQRLGRSSPLRQPKRTKEGHEERKLILQEWCRNLDEVLSHATRNFRSQKAGLDDWLDATGLAVTAKLLDSGEVCSVPAEPEYDALGLRMEIIGVSVGNVSRG